VTRTRMTKRQRAGQDRDEAAVQNLERSGLPPAMAFLDDACPHCGAIGHPYSAGVTKALYRCKVCGWSWPCWWPEHLIDRWRSRQKSAVGEKR
jgi:predicted RNA-binding Zn-ribbon protein involved in translation (DUF1610 family)